MSRSLHAAKVRDGRSGGGDTGSTGVVMPLKWGFGARHSSLRRAKYITGPHNSAREIYKAVYGGEGARVVEVKYILCAEECGLEKGP